MSLYEYALSISFGNLSIPGDDREKVAAIVRLFAEAGATWWMEEFLLGRGGPGGMRRRISQGPPRVE
jgi:hypothetical protein